MIKIEQAIYKLQRFADVFKGGNTIESQGTWDDKTSENKIKLTLNGIATKIGIQAPPKTQFFLNENGSNKFIIGRSGIWEINDPEQAFKIKSITFYKPEILNKETSITISADTSNLTNITNKHTNNITTLNAISDFNETEYEFEQYEGSDSIKIKLSDYWTVYTKLQNYYNEAYSKAYLEYKRQLYGSYSVTSGDLTNIIIDYEYDDGGAK